MKHATSMALHTYWLSCHGVLGVPAGEIRAAELAPILPSLFLLDLDPGAGLRFRFCGATIARRYGRDLSNDEFLALWPGDDRDALRRHIRIIALRSTGLVAGVLAETVGGGFSSFEMLLLPLVGETGVAGLIGSMARIGGHEETNRIRARVISQSLRSVRLLPPAKLALKTAVQPQLLTQQAPSLVRRQYRHLSVVSGGK